MTTLRDSQVMAVLAVDDIERASAFYRDTLGLQIDAAGDDSDSSIVRAGAGSRLLLYASGFKRGETTAASFLVADIETTVGELRAKGVTFQDYDLPGLATVDGIASVGDTKAAWFKDSEGNTIALTQGGS
ncbi:MAG: VOC family protein [Actinobacteria bacterium]|nr:VOC family protein [Actinomycetota bacterium]